MTLTFDLLTPKSIGVFLSLSSICVRSMKSLGQTLFELSRYNEVWTDRRTDKMITIGLPHLRWRSPNKVCFKPCRAAILFFLSAQKNTNLLENIEILPNVPVKFC